MFADHQPIISRYGRSGVDGFRRVVLFAMLSAHVHLWRMPGIMRQVDKHGLEAPDVLWGCRFEGCRRLALQAPALFRECEGLATWGADGLVFRLYKVYGLGIAKAGFAAQLIYGVSGCLDTHNLERFGIPLRRYRSAQYRGETDKTAARRVRDYNHTVERWGGTEKLWNTWCDYVARADLDTYKSDEHVSRLHCQALGLA